MSDDYDVVTADDCIWYCTHISYHDTVSLEHIMT